MTRDAALAAFLDALLAAAVEAVAARPVVADVPSCQKCGASDTRIAYCNGLGWQCSGSHGGMGDGKEHMRYACQRCGYGWNGPAVEPPVEPPPSEPRDDAPEITDAELPAPTFSDEEWKEIAVAGEEAATDGNKTDDNDAALYLAQRIATDTGRYSDERTNAVHAAVRAILARRKAATVADRATVPAASPEHVQRREAHPVGSPAPAPTCATCGGSWPCASAVASPEPDARPVLTPWCSFGVLYHCRDLASSGRVTASARTEGGYEWVVYASFGTDVLARGTAPTLAAAKHAADTPCEHGYAPDDCGSCADEGGDPDAAEGAAPEPVTQADLCDCGDAVSCPDFDATTPALPPPPARDNSAPAAASPPTWTAPTGAERERLIRDVAERVGVRREHVALVLLEARRLGLLPPAPAPMPGPVAPPAPESSGDGIAPDPDRAAVIDEYNAALDDVRYLLDAATWPLQDRERTYRAIRSLRKDVPR